MILTPSRFSMYCLGLSKREKTKWEVLTIKDKIGQLFMDT